MPNPFEYLPDVTDGRGDSRRPSDAGAARGGNAPGTTLVLAGAGTGKTSTYGLGISCKDRNWPNADWPVYGLGQGRKQT